MRILTLIKSVNDRYGSQMGIVKLNREFKRLGHEVLFVSFTKNAFEDVFNEAGLQYRRISPRLNFYKPWTFWQAQRQLQKICDEFQPDIVHSHIEVTEVLGQQVTLKKHIPHMITFRTEHWWGLDMILNRSLWDFRNLISLWRIYYRKRWLQRGNPVFTSISYETGEFAARGLEIDASKIHFIPNGIDMSLWGPSKWLQGAEAPTHWILACTSRLVYNKGLDLLIEAVSRPILANMPLEVWIIGEGDERETLEALIDKLGQRDRVKLLGKRGDVPDLLRQADLYVHPARTEAFSNAAFEAMATGLPTIVTDRTGVKDIIKDIPSLGRIIPANDVDALARAIFDLISDPEECRKQGERLRARAQSFSYSAVAQKYVELYNRMLQHRDA